MSYFHGGAYAGCEPVDSVISQKFACDIDYQICRICMEPQSSEGQLITPCRCKGTMQYIHEECLKTWLVAQEGDMSEHKCELCKTPFLMDFIIENKCTPRESCHEGLSQCLFIPLLFAVMFMLFIIVYLLAEDYLTEQKVDEQGGYTIALMATCSLSGFVILLLIVNATKEACCIARLSKWHIHSQNFGVEDDESRDLSVVEQTKEVQPVIVVPKTIVLRGKKLRTPMLNPPMNPVVRRGRAVAFTVRADSSQVSVIRGSDLGMRTDPLRRFRVPSASVTVRDNDSVPR